MKTQELDQLLGVIPLYGHFAPEDVIKKFSVQNSESTRRANAIISKNYTLNDFKKINEVVLNRTYGEFIPEALKLKLQQFLSSLAENAFRNAQISLEDMDIIQLELSNISQLMASEPTKENSLNMPHEIELSTLAIREYFLIKCIIATIDNSAVKNVQVNCEYQEEIPFLNSTISSLLNTCKLPYYEKYRDLWFDRS